MIGLTNAEIARFSARINATDGCHLWTGETKPHGYGFLSIYRGSKRTRIYAHRLSHFIATGEEPKVVRHTCDNPPCVNPAHLVGGTQLENMRDARDRGRIRVEGLTAWRDHRYSLVEQRVASGLKHCSHCRTTKTFDQFGLNKSTADGHQAWCRDCRRKGSAKTVKERRRILASRREQALAVAA